MRLKKKLKRVLAISMALSMIFCSNAFATPIDLANSVESVVTDDLNKSEGTDYFADEDTNIWADGQITERVDVTVQRESQFEVTIPKDIVLDGETGKADYIVNAKGDIAGNQKLSVVPDASFDMEEAGGKDSITATVTQDDTEYTYVEMQGDGTEYDGSIAATLTAGEWSGSFYFNIEFKDVSHIHNSDREIPEIKSWQLVSGDFSQNDKVWTSTNKTDNSTGIATWTITLNNDSEISIPYNVSSEKNYDKFTIKLDDTTIVNAISGTKSSVYETTLQQGTHTITATYSKDNSSDSGNDEGQLTLNDITDITYGCSEDDHIHEQVTEITKEPTFTETGVKIIKCNTCNYSKTETIPVKIKTLNDYTWEEISAISTSGEAKTTYGLKVGDTKEMTLTNGETYTAQIIGFNHDDLADGSGTAGITFQFKELMTATHVMNSTDTNVGGWEASAMRTYINNNVYNLLPSDLQTEIKEVSKISDAGNKDKTTLITTTDKLFLLSLKEVGLSSDYNVTGQGEQYEIYTDNASRIKINNLSGSATYWWLRSAFTNVASHFFCVGSDGNGSSGIASNANGVAPAFCI